MFFRFRGGNKLGSVVPKVLKMFRFRKRYFLLAILLFLVEVFIALYVHDKIVRPYIGDFLVVIFVYCLLRAFLDLPVLSLALLVLLFAYTVEILQYFKLVNILGLQHSKVARIILGTSFEWIDMLVYTLGIVIVVSIEKLRNIKDKN